MTLGKKLRFLRDRTDKNREEISKALNIKYSTYANYENDMRQPDLETIKIIAAHVCNMRFGVSRPSAHFVWILARVIFD